MAGVGEYIHYYYRTYKVYGTNEPGGSRQKVSQDIFIRMKKDILKKAKTKLKASSANNYKQLEAELNAVLYPEKGQDGARANLLTDSTRQSHIEDLVGEEAIRFITNWEQGGYTYDSFFGGQESFEPGKALRLKQQVERLIASLASSKRASDYEKNLNTLKTLAAQIDQLAEVANVQLSEYSTKAKRVKLNKNSRAIIAEINKSIAAISEASFLTALGKTFEGFVGSFDDKLTNYSEAVAVDLVKDIMTGAQGGQVHTDNKVSTKVHVPEGSGEINLSDFKQNNGKMDVHLVYNGEDYRISAKNYAMHTDARVHVLNSSPLLDIFGKNLTVKQINHLINGLGTSSYGTMYSAAKEVSQALIALEAIMGLSQEQGYANYLVINNRSSKQIIVKPIADLVSEIETGLSGFTTSGLDYEAIRTSNEWVGEKAHDIDKAYSRIGNLLTQLKQMKVSARLNTANWGWRKLDI